MSGQAQRQIRQSPVSLLLIGIVSGFSFTAFASAAEQRVVVSETIDFDRDILPIFENSCFRCHGSERPKSDFRLDNREDALRGGYLNTNNIVPGDSEASLLIKYVAREVEDMEMPPEGTEEPLTAGQIQVLRKWIDQGAHWSSETEFPRAQSMLSARPVIRWIGVDGDEQAFREHYGRREGWAGGLEYFELSEDVNDRSYSVTGRILPHDHDYRIELKLEERDTMFARLGWEQYRKYYDNSGGYYQPYESLPGVEPLQELDRELYVDHGKAWAQLGLILPEYPQIVLGYEYRFAEGEKSLLQWQPVIPTGMQNRNIAPAAKSIDSDAHLVSLDISYELAGFFLEDRVEFEDYQLRTGRGTVQPFVNPATVRQAVFAGEDYEHQRWMNVFRVEKQVRDWLFLSGGHMYHQLDGSGGLSINLVETPGQPSLTDDSITIEQWSQVGNLNAQFGPWQNFTLATGVQGEWSRQQGFGDLVLGTPPFLTTNVQPAMIQSDIDRFAVEEHAALRFTGVPRSVLFAEARLKQRQIGQYEEQFGNNTFLRDTDANTDETDARAGFQTSPWQRVSFGGHYRRRWSNNDYDHRRDLIGGGPGDGYSAFITQNDIDTEEIESRLVVRPANWIKTTLTYQRINSEYTTATDSVVGLPVPGGRLVAGESEANIYSIALSLSPIQRLQLSTTISYSESSTAAFDNGSGAIVPYDGDVYNLIFGGTYALNEKTDFNAQYYFSRADYEQHNATAGLPVGIAYDRHGLLVGVTRQWRENLTTGLQYGFFRYRESSAGGFNDYDAHAVFATFSMVLQ